MSVYWPGWVMRQPWIFRHFCFVLVGFACWFGLIPRERQRNPRAERLAGLIGLGGLVVVVVVFSLLALAAALAMLEPVLGWAGQIPFWAQLGGSLGALAGLAHRRGYLEVSRRL